MRRMLHTVCMLVSIAVTSTLPIAAAPEQAGEQLQLLVELEGEPATSGLGPNPTAAELALAAARAGRLRAAQQALAPTLSSLGARELFRAQLATNGIGVLVAATQTASILALPGVQALRPLVAKAATAQRTPISALATVAAPLGEETGRSVTIAIADSGIDYTHSAFAGSGTRAAYRQNNPAIVEPGSFPTAKVVGGIDLAGDTYDGASNLVPTPDADPLDCSGHGTSVAGGAAGLAVTTSGSTYTGPYTSGLSMQGFAIPPGVAPEASLVAIKMFGCRGSSTLTIPAIERALDPNGDDSLADRVDVLTLAITSPFGGDDPDVAAVNRATETGLIVIAPAGEGNGTFYSLASPGTASGALSIATLSDGIAGATEPQTTARGPARGNTLKPDLAIADSTIQVAAAASGNGTVAAQGGSVAVAQGAGAAALLVQRHPTWSTPWIKAALTTTSRRLTRSDGLGYPATLSGAGALATDQAVGTTLLAYSDEGTGLSFGTPTITSTAWSAQRLLTIVNTASYERLLSLGTLTDTTQGIAVTPLSSTLRLAAGEQAQVPVVARVQDPGLGLLADPFTPPLQQSSMRSAPRHFLAEQSGAITIRESGITRLRVAQYADLITSDLYIDGQLAVANLQTNTTSSYLELTPGTHRVQLFPIGARGEGQSLTDQTVAVAPGQAATLLVSGWTAELRVVVLDDDASGPANTSQLRVVNGAGSLVGPLDLYLGNTRFESGLQPGQTSAYLPVAQNQVTVTVRRSGTAASSTPLLQIKLAIDPGQKCDLLLLGRSPARLRATRLDNPLRNAPGLRVPYTISPVQGAQVAVDTSLPAQPAASGELSLALRNTGLRNSSDPANAPLVSVFELGTNSADNPALSGSLDAADLRYVGVTSDYTAKGQFNLSYAYFGIATYGSWNTPSEVRFRVEIDTSLVPDGIADYRVDTVDLGQLDSPPQPSDVFVALTYQRFGDQFVSTGKWSPINGIEPRIGTSSGLNSNPYNSSVLFVQAPAQTLGLDVQPSFRYRVLSSARDNGLDTLLDQTPWLPYTLTQPTLVANNRSLNFLPLFYAPDGAVLPVSTSGASRAPGSLTNLLLLYHHNPVRSQAELLPVIARPAGS